MAYAMDEIRTSLTNKIFLNSSISDGTTGEVTMYW